MQIKAAVARKGEPAFAYETLELDEPRADEILVQIHGVGLCHTDLVVKGLDQYSFPAVLGHEGAGVVVKTGKDVSKVAAGDRVALTFRSCGACDRCRSGDPAYCRTMPMLNYIGGRLDGSKTISDDQGPVSSNFFGQSSFASFALAYERNVVRVPDDVPLELMGPLGCGVQTGAGGVMRSLACKAGSSLLILGGGAVGLSAVMGAGIQGCETIILVEPHPSRRTLALELGATHAIDPAVEGDLAAAFRRIAPLGVDYALDTTGVPTVIQAAIQSLGSKGVIGIIGVAPPGTPIPSDLTTLMTFGHTIRGIIEGDSDPDVFIPELIEHYRAGRLPFNKMIRTYALSDINVAIEDQHRGVCVKAVLLPDRV
jgi:aryl-alcohol dehydrogenase